MIGTTQETISASWWPKNGKRMKFVDVESVSKHASETNPQPRVSPLSMQATVEQIAAALAAVSNHPNTNEDAVALVGSIARNDLPKLHVLASTCQAYGIQSSDMFVHVLIEAAPVLDLRHVTNNLIRRAALRIRGKEILKATPDVLAKNLSLDGFTPCDTPFEPIYLDFYAWLSTSDPVDDAQDVYFSQVLSLINGPLALVEIAKRCSRLTKFVAFRAEFFAMLDYGLAMESGDQIFKRAVGANLERMLRSGAAENAQRLFNVIKNSASLVSTVEPQQEDKLQSSSSQEDQGYHDEFDITVPTRHRIRLEGWRRLGERVAFQYSEGAQGTNTHYSVDWYPLWSAALMGKIPMNTAAACIGCLRPRTTLPRGASQVPTQPDEEGMVPVAFLSGLLKYIFAILASCSHPESNVDMGQIAIAEILVYCVQKTRIHVTEAMQHLPLDVQEEVKSYPFKSLAVRVPPNINRMFGDGQFWQICMRLSIELFRTKRTRICTQTLRNNLYKVVGAMEREGEAGSMIGCYFLQEMAQNSFEMDGVNTSDKEILFEETAAIEHFQLTSGDGVCCKQSGSVHLPIELLWRVFVCCSESDSSLIALARFMEQPRPSLTAQLSTPGAVPRVQLLAKSVCDRLKCAGNACKVNSLLRVLGSLSYCHSLGRTCVIEAFPWEMVIKRWVCLRPSSKNDMFYVKVNSFVVIHEVVMNASVSTNGSGNFSKSMFTSRRDDSLLVDIDRKFQLGMILLREGLDPGTMMRTGAMAVETCGKLIQMYKTAPLLGSLEEAKKLMASAAIDLMLELNDSSKSSLFSDERFCQGLSQFLTAAVLVCPLLHRLTTLVNNGHVTSAVLKCARYASKQIGEKLQSAITTKGV